MTRPLLSLRTSHRIYTGIVDMVWDDKVSIWLIEGGGAIIPLDAIIEVSDEKN